MNLGRGLGEGGRDRKQATLKYYFLLYCNKTAASPRKAAPERRSTTPSLSPNILWLLSFSLSGAKGLGIYHAHLFFFFSSLPFLRESLTWDYSPPSPQIP